MVARCWFAAGIYADHDGLQWSKTSTIGCWTSARAAGSDLPGGPGHDLHSFEMMAVKIISFGFAAVFQIAPAAEWRIVTVFEPNILGTSAPILE